MSDGEMITMNSEIKNPFTIDMEDMFTDEQITAPGNLDDLIVPGEEVIVLDAKGRTVGVIDFTDVSYRW